MTKAYSSQPFALHFGDPCLFCGQPFDCVEPGPCPVGDVTPDDLHQLVYVTVMETYRKRGFKYVFDRKYRKMAQANAMGQAEAAERMWYEARKRRDELDKAAA